MIRILAILIPVLVLVALCFPACGDGGGSGGGVTLVVHSMTPDNPAFICQVVGTVRNDNNYTVDEVTVEVDFKDTMGAVAAMASKSTTDLSAGDTWDFQIPCPIDDWHADSYDIRVLE